MRWNRAVEERERVSFSFTTCSGSKGPPEQLGGNIGDFCPLVGKVAGCIRNHGGRSADADHLLGTVGADSPDQHGNVCSLAATIGVEFVKDQKTEIFVDAIPDRAFTDPGQQQFQHHVVGEQDLRRILPHLCTGILTFLAGVLAESDRELLAGGILVILLVASELLDTGS